MWLLDHVYANPVLVGITDVEIENYEKFLSSQNKEAKDISNFNSPLLNRSIVSVILLQKAVYLGGYKQTITVEGVPNSARNFRLTQMGKFVALGYDIWEEAAKAFASDLYISIPVIENGVFEKGIYGLKSNKALFGITSLADLQRCCSILENKHWVVDHKTIAEMQIPEVLSTVTHESMVKMIYAGRADFALFEFGSNQDLSLDKYGVTLHAVHGYKVALRSSRHYAVSKTHPEGKKFFDALQKGIKILKQQDAFTAAYMEIGFINPKVKNWRTIN